MHFVIDELPLCTYARGRWASGRTDGAGRSSYIGVSLHEDFLNGASIYTPIGDLLSRGGGSQRDMHVISFHSFEQY